MRLAKWSELAEASWKALRDRSPADADRIAFAVVRFAETGEGRLERISIEDGTGRLYVDDFIITIGLPRDQMVVEVLWMHRRSSDR